MSYIVRNTVVLSIVLVLILAVGLFFTSLSLPKKLKNIESEIRRIEVELQNTPDLANTYNTVSARLDEIKKRWETRNKDVPPRDITGETYGYFNRTMDISGEIKMDMTYVGPRDFGSFGYNVYSLKGEGPFRNLYNFVWLTESGKRLFKVANLVLRGYESKSATTNETKILVLFEMEVQAYYSSLPELNNAPGMITAMKKSLGMNPFHPLIMHEIPPPQADEIEVERSILKAVIPGKAFIVDQNQKSRTLEEGDKVYLGYVTRILPNEGKVECLLNRGGVAERYELNIQQGQPLK
ncbi:MAG: hypothetical protein C0417_09815 [Chlorobiaceae bacterium]|nr:hypothetical protein [Chlorobiaceae bacterium]